jgi:hypothetical protein
MFGTDLLMRTIPAHFLEDRENTFSLSECCVLSFLAHLRNNVGVSGNVACGYLSGVRFMLLNSGVDIRFLDNSPCIKATRAGLHLLHRAENPECDKKALPVACEMILYAKNTLFNSNSIESMAICIAMQVGFCNLARVSEYIRTKGKHFFQAQHVVFTLTPLTEGGEPRYVASTDAHLHSEDDVTGMTWTLVTAKKDSEGSGNCIPISRDTSSTAAFDFVGDCFRWASIARPKRDAPFISTSDGWELSYSRLNAAIKKLATVFGLDPKRYSSHSLRIGGASALAAAGAPDYIIQLMGRWKSTAFLKYIQLATAAYKRAISSLADKSLFTVHSLRQMVPGAMTAAGL